MKILKIKIKFFKILLIDLQYQQHNILIVKNDLMNLY